MSFPPTSTSNRQDLIKNAILFLNDPKVQSSSLTSRITFLESKGLNDVEIQEALRQASGGGGHRTNTPTSSPPPGVPSYGGGEYRYGQGGGGQAQRYGEGLMIRPEAPRRDWRDLFVSRARFRRSLGTPRES